jgi:hypothetical protein
MNARSDKVEEWHVLGSSKRFVETRNKNAPFAFDNSKLPIQQNSAPEETQKLLVEQENIMYAT